MISVWALSRRGTARSLLLLSRAEWSAWSTRATHISVWNPATLKGAARALSVPCWSALAFSRREDVFIFFLYFANMAVFVSRITGGVSRALGIDFQLTGTPSSGWHLPLHTKTNLVSLDFKKSFKTFCFIFKQLWESCCTNSTWSSGGPIAHEDWHLLSFRLEVLQLMKTVHRFVC